MKKLSNNWLIAMSLFIFSINESQAQLVISNTLMASGSHTAQRPKLSLSSSFGETFIFSGSSDNIYFNQGFHNIDNSQLVSVNDLPDSDFWVSIFPNPAQNEISIDSKITFSTVEIFSHSGLLLKSIRIDTTNQIDISELQTGLYFIQLVSNDQIKYSGKFLKI